MVSWEWDRSRHRRERRYHAGYHPFPFHDDYETLGRDIEDMRYDRVSVTSRRRRGLNCHHDGCQFCVGDYREPYEFLRRYDPLDDLMGEVHDYWIAMETGRFIAQDAADRIEEASNMVNRLFGYNPYCKQMSVFMKQFAREIQLLPDNVRDPYQMRRGRAHLPWP